MGAITPPSLSLAALTPFLFVFGAAGVGVLIEAFAPRESRHPAQVGMALIIVTGVYPQPLIDLIRPAVTATISDVGGNAHGVTPVHSASEGK